MSQGRICGLLTRWAGLSSHTWAPRGAPSLHERSLHGAHHVSLITPQACPSSRALAPMRSASRPTSPTMYSHHSRTALCTVLNQQRAECYTYLPSYISCKHSQPRRSARGAADVATPWGHAEPLPPLEGGGCRRAPQSWVGLPSRSFGHRCEGRAPEDAFHTGAIQPTYRANPTGVVDSRGGR
jgi:hypothetical protein